MGPGLCPGAGSRGRGGPLQGLGQRPNQETASGLGIGAARGAADHLPKEKLKGLKSEAKRS